MPEFGLRDRHHFNALFAHPHTKVGLFVVEKEGGVKKLFFSQERCGNPHGAANNHIDLVGLAEALHQRAFVEALVGKTPRIQERASMPDLFSFSLIANVCAKNNLFT